MVAGDQHQCQPERGPTHQFEPNLQRRSAILYGRPHHFYPDPGGGPGRNYGDKGWQVLWRRPEIADEGQTHVEDAGDLGRLLWPHPVADGKAKQGHRDRTQQQGQVDPCPRDAHPGEKRHPLGPGPPTIESKGHFPLRVRPEVRSLPKGAPVDSGSRDRETCCGLPRLLVSTTPKVAKVAHDPANSRRHVPSALGFKPKAR